MRQAFIRAFEIWEREYREHPEDYLTPDQIAALDTMSLAEGRATCLIAFLDKLAAGKPWEQIA